MRLEDILYWLQAKPFRPFRITMTSGRTFDVPNPEMVRLMGTTLMLFTPSDRDNVYEWVEMIGLVLIFFLPSPLGGEGRG